MELSKKLFYYNLFALILISVFIIANIHFPLDVSLTKNCEETTRKSSRRIFKQNNITYVKDDLSTEIYYTGSDDALAIKEALESLPPSGGTIFISSGTYTLQSTIVINKSCILDGEGSGRSYLGEGITQLNFGNITALKIISPGVKISNLQLRGAGKTFQSCYGVYLDTSLSVLNQNIIVENVMIVDTYYAIYGAGIYDIWDLRLYDVYINYCNQGIRVDKNVGATQLQTKHVIIAHADSDAIYLTRVDAMILDSIYFIEPNGNGIVIASFGSYPLMIRNCQIDECHENGILINLTEYCSFWLTVTDTQIKAHKSAIYIQKAQDIILSNCHIAVSEKSTGQEPIIFIGDTHRVQINNCLIKNLSAQTRNCIELFNSRYCQVTNCHIDHSVGKAPNIDYAIKETGKYSDANIITCNICVGISEAPVYIYGMHSLSQNNI